MIHVDEAQVCLQQAQTYWQEQNWQLTIQACAKALAANQKLTDAHKLMGDALQRIGKSKEAIGYYVQAIAYKPDFAAVYANLGALYAKEKQWQRAIVHYQKAIEIKPEFVAAYRLLAKVYQMQNQPDKAQAYLAQAQAAEAKQTEVVELSANVNSPLSLQECLHQGQMLKQQGNLQAALEKYLQAAAIEPQQIATYKEIVALCEQLSMWAEAAKYCRLILQLSNAYQENDTTMRRQTSKMLLEQATPAVSRNNKSSLGQGNGERESERATSLPGSIEPKSAKSSAPKAEYHYNLGTLHSNKQEWSEAVKQYQEAISIDPQMTKAHRHLARALAQIGDRQSSSEALLQAFTLENEAVGAEEYIELAENLASWGKMDSAIICYRRAVARQPDLAAAYLGWGGLLVQQKLGEEAIACYIEGLKHTQDGELYYRLGRLYRAKEEWLKAALCYQKATVCSPEHGAAYHELGEAHSAQKQWHEAISSYRQAVKYQPDFSWSYNNLGFALIQLGQWSEAIPVYQEAVKLNPEFPWAYFNLAEAYSKLSGWSEAVDLFQQAAKIQPDLPRLQQKLGEALYQRSLQDKELALKHFNLAIQQEPDEPEAYQQALAIDKMNLELYLQLGDILANRGEVEQAIATFQTALQIQPKNSVAIARLQALSLPGEIDLNSERASLPAPPAPQIIEFSPEDLKF